MAHVFIVNEDTFNTHLSYMFAGTGAKDLNCDFLQSTSNNIESERLLVSMIADISRLRENDDVIFYLQQAGGNEGQFFGSFKVKTEPFLSDVSYLKEELNGKGLNYRVQIKAGEVYPIGVTERECLDSLEGIEHPSQLCWSLIYRKLKGNRGCTMITDYEYAKIMEKIRKKNNNIKIEGESFNYDKDNNIIIQANECKEYVGNKKSLDVEKRLIYKASKNKAYEAHLQAYIMQNYNQLSDVFVKDLEIKWIGNEVSCGVGMQSIDAVFIQEDNERVFIHMCELKDEELYKNPYISNQIKKYINWMIDYIVPIYEKRVVLCPIVISSKISDRARNINKEKNANLYNDLSQQFKKQYFDNFDIDEIKFVEFQINNNEIKFERRNTDG